MTGELSHVRFGPGVQGVKTDRKNAELLARQLLAGSLTAVVIPTREVEAAREMARAHDVCRQELMRARHRVSKMLLRHGRAYPKQKTWIAEHRRWAPVRLIADAPRAVVAGPASAGACYPWGLAAELDHRRAPHRATARR